MADGSPSKSKQVVEGVGDAAAQEAINHAFQTAFSALADALACVGNAAADCGVAAVQVSCGVVGSMLDGV